MLVAAAFAQDRPAPVKEELAPVWAHPPQPIRSWLGLTTGLLEVCGFGQAALYCLRAHGPGMQVCSAVSHLGEARAFA